MAVASMVSLMKHVLWLCLIAAPAAAQTVAPDGAPAAPEPGAVATCPAGQDDAFDLGRIIARLDAAPKGAVTLPVEEQLWRGWTMARGDVAQSSADDGALNRLDALLDACPDDVEGHNRRAFVHYQQQDYDAALADLDRALKIAPTHAPAMAGKALTLMKLGRADSAQAMLRESIQLNMWLRLAALPEADRATDP